MATQKRRLGEILVTSGEITQTQLEQALAEQKTNGKRLGETLISLNFLTERKMLKTAFHTVYVFERYRDHAGSHCSGTDLSGGTLYFSAAEKGWQPPDDSDERPD